MRDGFLIVVSAWLALVLVGALPFVLMTVPHISYVDAVFESMSGLTTTGATIVTHIDALPRAVLYYRQQLQWLGGMGIIVLAVAILPMLRIGGMQLYRAETPGPMKDAQAHPAHHRDRQGTVVNLRRHHRGLHIRLLAGRNETLRCCGPRLQHSGHRWFFHP